MVFDVRMRFVLHSRRGIKILISDRYKNNMNSTSLVEKLLLDAGNRLYCGYKGQAFCIQFKQGNYFVGAVCKIVPSKGCKVVLGKQWIEGRKATFDEEIHILKIFIHDVWY